MKKVYFSKIWRSLQHCQPLQRQLRPVILQILQRDNLPDNIRNADASHSIFIKEKERFRKIEFQAILYVEALGSYCCVHLAEGRDLTLSFTLAEITPKLNASFFLRVHRSYIVNIDRIDSFIGNTLCIGQHRIPVSKQHRSEVMRQFNILGCSK